MTLKIHDTLTREKRDFVPADPKRVTMYVCGPTVYNYAHIGNLRTYLFEDGLVRTLKLNGYRVNHVMNITDVGHLHFDPFAHIGSWLALARLTTRPAGNRRAPGPDGR